MIIRGHVTQSCATKGRVFDAEDCTGGDGHMRCGDLGEKWRGSTSETLRHKMGGSQCEEYWKRETGDARACNVNKSTGFCQPVAMERIREGWKRTSDVLRLGNDAGQRASVESFHWIVARLDIAFSRRDTFHVLGGETCFIARWHTCTHCVNYHSLSLSSPCYMVILIMFSVCNVTLDVPFGDVRHVE